jgi:hypothetical protein
LGQSAWVLPLLLRLTCETRLVAMAADRQADASGDGGDQRALRDAEKTLKKASERARPTA